MLEFRRPGQTWVEPFVGGANVIDKVTGPRMGFDSNPYLIALYKALQSGWEPPEEVNKDLYQDIKRNKESYPEELVGFVGHGCSYMGKWFGSHARSKARDNQAASTKRVLIKQLPLIKDVLFNTSNYINLNLPDNCLIYCDPPYKGTYCDYFTRKFDHDQFWDWCRLMKQKGHTVFVSEFSAPSGVECVAEIPRKWNVNTKQHRTLTSTERLYKI